MSKIIIKSPREIEIMRENGKIMIELFDYLESITKPGISTYELDDLANKFVVKRGGRMASFNYEGFPGHICISLNDTLIHGIPSKKIILKDGDIVSYDVVIEKNGYMVDACRTFPVGNVSKEALELIKNTQECFFEAVKLIKPGIHLGDVQEKIFQTAKKYNLGVTLDFGGHGIGQSMHEDPMILNYGKKGFGVILKEGMALCIEPMVTLGKGQVFITQDGWTVKTSDKSLSCHYENTVIVTSTSYEIITLKGEEK